MALTLAQIQTMITNKEDSRQIINEIVDYLEANPGGGGGVDSVTAGDASITVGGTATEPTVKLPYLSYVASLEQSSTNAPIPTVKTNTLGGVPVWSYNADGDFSITLANAFGLDPVVFITADINMVFNCGWQYISQSEIKLLTYDETWTGMNGFNKVSFEIRIYPA